jgi:hypothetical protein
VYTLDILSLPPGCSKIGTKPKIPLQIYYKLPLEQEWRLGYFVLSDTRLYLAKSFRDLSNDSFNYEFFFNLFGTKIKLHDITRPFISIERECYADYLEITTGFSAMKASQTMESNFITPGLEYLFYLLNYAAAKVPICINN